jgi:hypothetical protein
MHGPIVFGSRDAFELLSLEVALATRGAIREHEALLAAKPERLRLEAGEEIAIVLLAETIEHRHIANPPSGYLDGQLIAGEVLCRHYCVYVTIDSNAP